MVVSAAMNSTASVVIAGCHLFAYNGTLASGRDSRRLREVQRVLEDRFRCEIKVLIRRNGYSVGLARGNNGKRGNLTNNCNRLAGLPNSGTQKVNWPAGKQAPKGVLTSRLHLHSMPDRRPNYCFVYGWGMFCTPVH